MQQRNPWQRVWRLISPLVVKMIVAFIVEMLAIMGYMIIMRPDAFMAIQSQEELMQRALEISDSVFRYITEISAAAAFCTIPILWWMFHHDRKMEMARGVEQPKKAPLMRYVLLLGLSIPFALGTNNIIILSGITQYSEAYQEVSKVLYTPAFPVQILCVGIVIPIMEELIFRGLIYKRMREYMPMMAAVIYSGIFFGLYHGNFVQMIYGGLCGLLLAYCYEKFGSLKAPMLMHITMNVLACTLTEFGMFDWILAQPVRMGLITVACAAIGSAFFVKIKEM